MSSMKKISLYLVDDHLIVLDGIKSMLLGQEKYEVSGQAQSAEEAWTAINSGKIKVDILITDISMSGKSGIDLCLQIKALNCSIKVLILSMYNNVEYVRRAIDCEADGYILKNTGKAGFLKALDGIMEDGAYFSHEIIPLIYKDEKSKAKKEDKVQLTQREKEVLNLILQEMTSIEIADKLFISKQTVDTHRLNIMAKTSCKSIVALIKFAIREGYYKVD